VVVRFRVVFAVLAAIVIAGISAAAATARSPIVRTVPIRGRITNVTLSVPHQTGSRPPAILLSIRPANLRCVVSEYRYRAVNKRGTFKMKLRCPRAPSGARARLVFRAPYLRVFALRNGTGTVRVKVDKPPGNVRPLGDLTTRPRDTNCKATPTGHHVGARVFTASARVKCQGLPAHAKGVLAVGGLLATGRIAMTPSTMSTATAAEAPGCREPSKLTFQGHTIEWRDCFGHPYTVGPWGSTYFGVSPPALCPAGWTLGNGPIGGIARNYFPPKIQTEPKDAWWWSNVLGVVTNWQFSGDITFQWAVHCYPAGH
jgi:hypothetical protein